MAVRTCASSLKITSASTLVEAVPVHLEASPPSTNWKGSAPSLRHHHETVFFFGRHNYASNRALVVDHYSVCLRQFWQEHPTSAWLFASPLGRQHPTKATSTDSNLALSSEVRDLIFMLTSTNSAYEACVESTAIRSKWTSTYHPGKETLTDRGNRDKHP
ncbi:hypothetical protein PGT21_036155 [Puccinia graminis f. sp. tritici]|uniref:Uncharacterized protein n=1 Tax=Puccinia graminis f. sp. tritici TaxID=56615 RepID=A0A5B0QQI4_PUCGR|nr:hypothetical protein PGT21_036155 [Puccinia graminis f. sp. tritici]